MGCVGKTGVWAGQDAAYLKEQDAERIGQSALNCSYYSLNRGKNVDPLYNEPNNDPLYGGSSDAGTDQVHNLSWNFCPDVAGGDDEFVFPCNIEYVEFDDRNPMVRPEGKVVEYDAIASVSVSHWECAIEGGSLPVCLAGRAPKEGDVLYGVGEWWDVVKVGGSGTIPGTYENVGYKMQLKKRTQFVPDRKVNLG